MIYLANTPNWRTTKAYPKALSDFPEEARTRLKKAAKLVAVYGVYVEDEVVRAAEDGKLQAPIPVNHAVPYEQWPRLAKFVALWKAPEDKGVGDTLKRSIDFLGGGTIAEMFKEITGVDCGCTDRVGWLNSRFTYGGEQ